jgi:hypothetical protein
MISKQREGVGAEGLGHFLYKGVAGNCSIIFSF